VGPGWHDDRVADNRAAANGTRTVLDKVTLRRLPEVGAPIPPGGGRMVTGAGEMAQIVNGEAFRYLSFLEFRADPTASRGNHYHAVKTEHLYIVDGLILATYVDVDSGEEAQVELRHGDLVAVAPRCAHSYIALEHSHAVEYTAFAFDPEDTVRHTFNAVDLSTMDTAPAHRLRLLWDLPYRPERVWRALTDAGQLRDWFWPQSLNPTVTVDLTVHGRYHIDSTELGHGVGGTYRLIDPPGRLEFTWQWDHEEYQSLVTIELTATATGTLVAIRHTGFPTASERDNHIQGWSDCLERLPAFLARESGAAS
jgi:uncharacterized protein YndB with AHSA1/START domain